MVKGKTQNRTCSLFPDKPCPPDAHPCPLSAGAMYGNGAYFAIDPAYSRRYAKADAQGQRRMYLARVLVGDFAQGQPSLAAPPVKNPAQPSDLYDSVTDQVANPSMFVIFNDVQAYPEFIITFT